MENSEILDNIKCNIKCQICYEKFINGMNCHDYPKIQHIYKYCDTSSLYGRGISYTNLLEPILHNHILDDTIIQDITPFNISNADFNGIKKIKKYNGESHALPYLSSKRSVVGIYSFSLKHFGLLFPCFLFSLISCSI